MKRLRSKFTYANVMATIAVFISLGGAGYAAIRLPRNSVGTRQIQNGAVTGAKLKKGAVTASAIAPGAITPTAINPATLGTVPTATNAVHATTADSAAKATSASNAATLGGLPASTFAPADVVRSAIIEGGTVVPAESVGISQSNVTSYETGVYCVGNLTPAPRTAVVANAFGPAEIFADVVNFSVNPEGGACQVYVETRNNSTTRIPGTFAILIR